MGGDNLNDADLLNELEQLQKLEQESIEQIPVSNKVKIGGQPSAAGPVAEGQGPRRQASISDLERRLKDLDEPAALPVP